MTKKLYHGAAYYPELWPETAIEGDIAEMRRLGINVVRMGEFAWATMEPEEGRISVAFFRKVMDRLHEAGIAVVFCTPTPTPPIWLTHGHPERCFVDAEGRVMAHGARQHASYEDEAVRAACFRIVEAVAQELGRHPALVAWQIDNEFKCHVAEDFNPSAVRAWHRWLEKRYGTVAQLNEAWGTEIWSQRYQRFDQVPAPVRTPFLHNASLSTAFRVFSRERIAEFMDEQSALVRRHSAAPITHNLNFQFAINVERMGANLDFVSFDDYPDRDHWATLVFDNDLARAAKPGRAHWLMETSAVHNGWLTNHDTAHPPGFLVAEAVSTYALGAEAFCYWLWRQQRTGAELPHSALMSAWFKPTAGHAQVAAVEEARRQLEGVLSKSRPAPAEVALTWSDLGRMMIETEPLGGSAAHVVKYTREILGWHRVLCDAGLHRDVRCEGASLEGLRLLVTPLMPHASAEFLARVEAFVQAGGVWICGPGTGARTGEHTVPTDGGLGAVERLAGVEAVFTFPVTGTGAKAEMYGMSAPLAGWCAALRPTDAATRVAGALHSAIAPGLAFATERRIGRGAVVVLGAQPTGREGQELLVRLVSDYAERAGVGQHYAGTPGTLVCPRSDGVWVVINLDGQGGEITWECDVGDVLTGETIGRNVTVGPYGWRVVRGA